MYQSLFDKMRLVDNDFKESDLFRMGPVPTDHEDRKVFFHTAIQYAGDFMERYKSVKDQVIYKFVLDTVDDYMATLERVTKQMKGK